MPPYILKRVEKEIERDWGETNDLFVFLDTFNNGICNFVVFEDCLGFNHPFLTISIDFNNSTFPFSPPKNVKINSMDYYDIIVKYTSLSAKYLERISGKKCLCCSSLLCRSNWNTQISIKDIINEVIENIKLKQRIVEIIHGEKIIDKYFGFYLPVVEFL